MRWVVLAFVGILAGVSCSSGDGGAGPVEAPSTSAAVLASTLVARAERDVTPGEVVEPMVPSFQLEMAYLSCMDELEAEISDFDARVARCEAEAFGIEG